MLGGEAWRTGCSRCRRVSRARAGSARGAHNRMSRAGFFCALCAAPTENWDRKCECRAIFVQRHAEYVKKKDGLRMYGLL